MDPARFDRLATQLATRPLTRRRTLAAGTALLGGLLGAWRGAHAQPATPPATPTVSNGGVMAADNSTLFVQTATDGTFRPNPAAATPPSGTGTAIPSQAGAYQLTLHGHSGETIAFSDRPQRQFGAVPTPRFLHTMGFTPVNPPNAALVADTAEQAGDILLVELLSPAYDAGSHTLTYGANILTRYQGVELTPLARQQQDQRIAPQLTNVSLFIDDCANGFIQCYDANGTEVANTDYIVGYCWNWGDACCGLCQYQPASYAAQCNSAFPSVCHGQCTGTPVAGDFPC